MIATGVAPPSALPWLLAGPGPTGGPEPLAAHVERLGLSPPGGHETRREVALSGLRGRGGARFATWRKWEAVAERARGSAVVLVNGAEGEPASLKDQVLMHLRPHLVLDGAMLAAQSIGASEVVLYVNRAFRQAGQALESALEERRRGHWQQRGARARRVRARVAWAPPRYVAGEESAAVNFINRGEARPTLTPPRPFERGVGGRPTLVQNVETLAVIALIARFGSRWYRGQGTPDSPGSMLVTVGGAVRGPGVYEVPHGVRLDQVVEMAGATAANAPAILVGGYFGTWVPGHRASSLSLDDQAPARAGAPLGTGVVFVLPDGCCGVAETATILRFLARESAQQCGPCRFGLAALADQVGQLAVGRRQPGDDERLHRWTEQLGGGRGACKHPDGAVGLLRSAFAAFERDFDAHLRYGACQGAHRGSALPIPPPFPGWR